MATHQYKLSPYTSVVENHLFQGTVQIAVAHLLSGEVVFLTPTFQSLIAQLKAGKQLVLDETVLNRAHESELGALLDQHILMSPDADPIASFLDYLVVRPKQNPALAFRASNEELIVVHPPMCARRFSPSRQERPQIVEETLSSPAAEILPLADGTRTLLEILNSLSRDYSEQSLREAFTFLSAQERQLIKLAPTGERLFDPTRPFNTVPRNFYRSERSTDESVTEFHQGGIDDALWEFDWVETTVNHAFRFPSDALAGLNYGAKFADATLELIKTGIQRLKMLEIGGGTGSFARSFLDRLSSTRPDITVEYHLMDLAPTLFEKQAEVLRPYLSAERHYLQNATKLDLSDHEFHLIVANEVIADFPVSPVERQSTPNQTGNWQGSGAAYVERFSLDVTGFPEAFVVNSGLFDFLERVWRHIKPGGLLVLSEYGTMNRAPVRTPHLNHDEFSINFAHLEQCGRTIGFECRTVSLKQFLGMKDQIEFLDGQEETILCLDHILSKFGKHAPYAAISKAEFEERWGSLAREIELIGTSFSPLTSAAHFGPTLDQFVVAILEKPTAA